MVFGLVVELICLCCKTLVESPPPLEFDEIRIFILWILFFLQILISSTGSVWKKKETLLGLEAFEIFRILQIVGVSKVIIFMMPFFSLCQFSRIRHENHVTIFHFTPQRFTSIPITHWRWRGRRWLGLRKWCWFLNLHCLSRFTLMWGREGTSTVVAVLLPVGWYDGGDVEGGPHLTWPSECLRGGWGSCRRPLALPLQDPGPDGGGRTQRYRYDAGRPHWRAGRHASARKEHFYL